MVTKATYAVIGDMHEIVPAINEELGPPPGVRSRRADSMPHQPGRTAVAPGAAIYPERRGW